MARSAGLALYLASRALTERGKAKPEQKPGLPLPRPEGEVAWFAVGPGARPGAIVELARRFEPASFSKAFWSRVLIVAYSLMLLRPAIRNLRRTFR